MSDDAHRWAWAEVHLDAVAHNVAVLREVVGEAALWAVVKADGYGHGAVAVARTAVAHGAEGLCVALVQEGLELRAAGIDVPVLVLSEQPTAQLPSAVAAGLTSTTYSMAQITALQAAAASAGRVHDVQLKVDTGMHRVGCHPTEAVALAAAVEAAANLRLDGVFTHLAAADEPGHPATVRQLAVFDEVIDQLAAAGLRPPRVHAANSAAALAHPAARRSLVRAGIALYGISPGAGVDHLATRLRPALALHARVSHVKRVAAGERISYGLRHEFTTATTVATVPIGYADGVPRRLWATGGEVLVGGVRRPIVGVVTMDQLMVDVGDDLVAIGDPVVLLGRQGDEEITAAEWAERLGTIGYEIVCGISRRVERRAAVTPGADAPMPSSPAS